MGGIGYLWYITQTAPFYKEVGSTMIVDKVGLQQFISTLAEKKSIQKSSLILYRLVFY